MTTRFVLTALGLVVMGYVFGSLSPSVFLGKAFKGLDVRQHGSGNAGTTNAFRVLGTRLGIAVLLGDILKGVIPVLIARLVLAGEDNGSTGDGVRGPCLHRGPQLLDVPARARRQGCRHRCGGCDRHDASRHGIRRRFVRTAAAHSAHRLDSLHRGRHSVPDSGGGPASGMALHSRVLSHVAGRTVGAPGEHGQTVASHRAPGEVPVEQVARCDTARYTEACIGTWRSLVAHPAGGRKVASSNLAVPTRQGLHTRAFFFEEKPCGVEICTECSTIARAIRRPGPRGAQSLLAGDPAGRGHRRSE